MPTSTAILGQSLYTSIFNPLNGNFLAGGTITWFAEDKTTLESVYKSPVIDPLNAYPNPYQLDSVAAEPPFYYDPSIATYWIEIRPAVDAGCDCADVEPIYSFFFYPNQGSGGSSQTSEITNFVTNGQFSHPIPFNKPTETAGVIKNSETEVAQAWFFDTDAQATSTINVTFLPVYTSQFEGNPNNEINVSVGQIGTAMDKLNLRQKIGFVNILQNEAVTLSLFGLSNSSPNETLKIYIEQISNSSQTTLTAVGVIQLSNVANTQSLSFTVPPVNSGTIDPSLGECNLIIQFPLLKIINISLTNIQIERGTIANPTYIEIPADVTSARTFANDLAFPTDQIAQAGYADYWPMKYFNQGFNWYTHDTGTAKPVLASACPPDMIIADGSVLKPTEYSTSGIPYMRLYTLYGNTFGGTTDIIATSAQNVITASSSQGGRELTAWSAGTSGFTIAQTVKGLNLGIKASLGSTSTSVNVVFLDNFAPGQGNSSLYLHNTGVIQTMLSTQFAPSDSKISVTTTNPGSTTTAATCTLTFNSQLLSDYKTNVGDPVSYPALNILTLCSVASPTQYGAYYIPPSGDRTPPFSPMCIKISLDGKINDNVPQGGIIGSEKTLTVPFLSNSTLQQNIFTFVTSINNPFTYTVTMGASLPAASSYFLYSSTTINYCLWFTVDGAGTQPSPAGFGGTFVQVDLLSSDSISIAAGKIAAAMDKQNFTLPTQADFGVISNVNLKWAIYL